MKAANPFEELDNAGVTPFHLKIMFVAGMGFFTDAYDLFIIGVALTLLKPIWHLSAFQVSVLGSSSLLAAAVGAVTFGRIADVLGRKRIYGVSLRPSRPRSGGWSSFVSFSASASAATTR